MRNGNYLTNIREGVEQGLCVGIMCASFLVPTQIGLYVANIDRIVEGAVNKVIERKLDSITPKQIRDFGWRTLRNYLENQLEEYERPVPFKRREPIQAYLFWDSLELKNPPITRVC